MKRREGIEKMVGHFLLKNNMLAERTNIFERDKINWESWVKSLLWHNIVYHKNEYSGCNLMIEPHFSRHYKKGDIVGDVRFLSYYIGVTRPLTWKELALVLGFWKDHLTPDGHDCEICEDREKCHAYFKGDKDQERCSGWMEKHGKPDDEAEYQKFLDNLMNFPTSLEIKMDQEQMELIMKKFNIKTDE